MSDCIDEDYMLFMLNTLGQTYNSSSKFNVNNKIIADLRDLKFINFVNESFDKGYMIKNQEGYNFYELSEIKHNDQLYFDIEFLEEKSKINIIYKVVILKYPNSSQNNHENNMKHYEIKLSSLSKRSQISIGDILNSTSKMMDDENRVVVDFRYNKRNKYKQVNKHGNYSIVLDPGFVS